MELLQNGLDNIFAVGHRTRLGRLGEQLAIEALQSKGFTSISDLNNRYPNNVFADVGANRDGVSYIISVKTRNRLTDKGGLNSSYNILKIAAYKDKTLKAAGLSTADITNRLYEELNRLAIREAAIPAWVAVSVDTTTATHSAYFGVVSDLARKRSIPMTATACLRYEALVVNRYDARITTDLSNAHAPN